MTGAVRDFDVGLAPSRRKSRLRLYAAGAVAAGVLVGGGAVALVELGTGSGGMHRTVQLRPYGSGSVSATARIDSSHRMTIDASSLPRLDARHRYEVWLTDAARTQMQPIGWLDADGTAQLTVPDALLANYQDVEVSVQQVDAKTYEYSGTSVLRGAL
jgi:hypothetical protein